MEPCSCRGELRGKLASSIGTLEKHWEDLALEFAFSRTLDDQTSALLRTKANLVATIFNLAVFAHKNEAAKPWRPRIARFAEAN